MNADFLDFFRQTTAVPFSVRTLGVLTRGACCETGEASLESCEQWRMM